MRCMNRARHIVGALALMALLFAPAAALVNAQEATTFSAAVVTNNAYVVSDDGTLRHNIPNLQVTRNGVSHTVNFVDHYNATGGLTRWGYPTSEVMEEEIGNLAQYYQRGVVDWHWRADLGRYVMERRLAWDYFGGGLGGSIDQGVEPGILNPHPGTVLGEWGHKVSDFSIDGRYTGFKSFFDSLGGVEAFGYPKTDARIDTRARGTLRIGTPGFTRQYFQAAVFEHHLGDPEPVKLVLLGDDLRNLNYPNESWKTYAAFRSATPLSRGQRYNVPRVTPRYDARGQPVVAVPTATPRPGTPIAPTATPRPVATPIPTATPVAVTPTPIPKGTSVWFGTSDRGVYRYDGTNWITYRALGGPIPHDNINDIFIAADGSSKWIATQNGLARQRGGTWSEFTTSTTGFAGNQVTAVHVLGDLIWIATDGGGASFGRIAGGNIAWEAVNTGNSELPSNTVRDVLVVGGQLNRAWLATDSGVAYYDNGNWVAVPTVQTGADALSLAIDNAGNIWVGTNGSGVSVSDSVTWTNYNTNNSDLIHDTVRSITVGPDGRVWLATPGGVGVYNGATWTRYTTFTSDIASNDVYDIAIDEAGRVWIATNGGASLLENGVWRPLAVAYNALRAVAVE